MDSDDEVELEKLPRKELVDMVKSLQEQIYEDSESYRHFRDLTNAKISTMEDEIHHLKQFIAENESKFSDRSRKDEIVYSHEPIAKVLQPLGLVTVPFREDLSTPKLSPRKE
jgi:hypothetical protein